MERLRNPVSHSVVRARADGRGGPTPFGLSSKDAKAFAGETVYLGDRQIRVGIDGRPNIPKSLMDKYGVKGDDGRMRVGVTFSRTAAGDLGIILFTPKGADINAKTGDRSLSARDVVKDQQAYRDSTRVLVPEDAPDFNWSPV